MRTRILMVAAALAATALAGCSTVVDGTGSEATDAATSGGFPTPTAGSSGPTPIPTPIPTDTPTDSGPTTSGGTGPAPDFTCPDITYSGAHITFNCLSNAMTVSTTGSVYTITMKQTVETSTGWQMEMGAQRYEGSATTFPAISSDIRGDLLSSGSYGTSPTYDLDTVNYSTISGKKAYTTVDTVTLNPAWAKQRKTAVKTEKRYLVIIEYQPGMYTTWFASIPDLAKQYWSQVPAAIASIKINP